LVTKPQLVEVHTALADLETRKRDALAAVAGAKRKIEQSKAEIAQFNLENQTQLEQEITAAEREISDNLESMAGSQEAVNAIRADAQNPIPETTAGGYAIEIIRPSEKAPKVIPATETTLLEAGDLVRVRTPEGKGGLEPHASFKSEIPVSSVDSSSLR
jgi:chromosome segregation ATPase